MSWLFKWLKLIDTIFMRYRKMVPLFFVELLDKPCLLDQWFYKTYRVREINHQRFVYDISVGWLDIIVWVILSILGFLALYFLFSFVLYDILQITNLEIFRLSDDKLQKYPINVKIFLSFVLVLMTFFLFPSSLLGILYPFFKPKERLVIFDRENQTVTLPQRYWGGKSEVIPFLEFKVKNVSDYGATLGQYYINSIRPGDGQPCKIGRGNNDQEMSLFSQYMRKGTMPLPEGELLDPYRQLDPFTKMQDEL